MNSHELTDLKRRLLEAEETIRAIRTGEVDALVVGSAGSEDVFEIGGDTESYRTFMEVMGIGAAALDDRGRILYANNHLSTIFDLAASDLQGEEFVPFIRTSTGLDLSNLFNPEAAGKLQIEVGAGHYAVASTPLRVGTVRGCAVTFTDVTESVKAEHAVASERAARAVIASANEAVLVCDRLGVITHANGAAGNVFAGNLIGQLFSEAVPLVFPGATGLMQAEDVIAMAVGGSSVQGIEATAVNAPSVRDYLVSAAPLQLGVDEAISGCVVTMVDLSQRKASEKQQLLLMRELDHRVKNTLALVLSIAGRTIHHEDTLEGFHRSFTGRIQALAATHNLLAENSWTDLTIGDIVKGELAPYVAGHAERVEVRGLDTAITPRAAIAFGLVIHELATNAAKYGALSTPEGQISVRALSDIGTSGESLHLEWQETGGPPVLQPSRKGFGQTVIARSLQYSADGGADLDYLPQGVRCLIRIPADDLR